jgi:hypothetical protein
MWITCVYSDLMTFDLNHSLNESLVFFVKKAAGLKLRLRGTLYR